MTQETGNWIGLGTCAGTAVLSRALNVFLAMVTGWDWGWKQPPARAADLCPHWRARAMAWLLAAALGSFCIPMALHAASPGKAIRLANKDVLARVAHQPAFNSYPFTVTAWFRTSESTSFQGIVSKYVDASGDGWALIVDNGRLRGFCYRKPGIAMVRAIDATSTASVADGYWHHAAMTVDASGGRLFLDGVQVGVATWNGAAGPPATTAELRIGSYSSTANPFKGDLDQVTYWGRSLGLEEVKYLKNRELKGREQGLVGLWNFDSTVSSGTVPGVPNLVPGSSSPAELVFPSGSASPIVDSTAPILFDSLAGNAISLNGLGAFATVNNTPAFDALTLPLTISAWIKTSSVSTTEAGIISKSFKTATTANGFAITLLNGRVYAWYRNGTTTSGIGNPTGPGLDGGFVADGQWHHVAFVVSSSEGRLLVDGIPKNKASWTGPTGPATTTQPLLVGAMSSSAPTGPFSGEIDEVVLRRAALSDAEVQGAMSRLVVGTEANLIACWHFDESQSPFGNALPNGPSAVLASGATRVGSTAFLGNGSTVTAVTLGSVTWQRRFAIQGTGQSSFLADVSFQLQRLDEYGRTQPSVASPASVPLTLALSNAAQAPQALKNQPVNVTRSFLGSEIITVTLPVEPLNQLDSVASSFVLSVTAPATLGTTSPTGPPVATPPTRLLHFNGQLRFGDVVAVMSGSGNQVIFPTPTPTDPFQLTLSIAPPGAYLMDAPAITLGTTTPLGVSLDAAGWATVQSGSIALPTQAGVLKGIGYRLLNPKLSATGLSATLRASFPTGFGLQTTELKRVMIPHVRSENVPVRAWQGQLLPKAGVVTFSASAQPGGATSLWFHDESKPLVFKASGVKWDINAGTFSLDSIQASVFVRRSDDDALFTELNNLKEKRTGVRMSNDGFYRDVTQTTSLSVRADANGASLLSMKASLATSAQASFNYHPHIPYTPYVSSGDASNQGLIVKADTSRLDVEDDLFIGGSLDVSKNILVQYAVACQDSCPSSGASPLGALIFSGTNAQTELQFTPDGGLVAAGQLAAISQKELNWGLIPNGKFAHVARPVGPAVYLVPGTFLRGDQMLADNVDRPGILLLTGWGNETGNPRQGVERPGTPGYAKGLANYAGLNFRSVNKGQSTVAGVDTGEYALASRSKYYARFAGISGIHQAQSFTNDMRLYGYAFSFKSFGFSFLDSINHESRTDARVVVPYPSNFFLDLEQVTLTCLGNLDKAEVPTGTIPKTLAYWQTNIKPLSVSFNPMAAELPCSVANRTLVLGVSLNVLPTIKEELSAILGFKTNGNIACRNDQVAMGSSPGVLDSRFFVPANLTIQGPQNSSYPFATAAKAFFNNWEKAPKTPSNQTETNGFINVIGKLGVHLFKDIRVHVHVRPISATLATVFMMGGWPADGLAAPDRGWSEGGKNYFTDATFDPGNDGYPVTIHLDVYRKGTTDAYKPRAQLTWLDVASLDYPLEWNDNSRQFKGFQETTAVLPVVDVQSTLYSLSPGKADFDFRQQIKVAAPPRIKALDFVNDALNEPLSPIQDALKNAVGEAALGTITDGLNALPNLLLEHAERSLVNPFSAAATTQIGAIRDGLKKNLQADLTVLLSPLQESFKNDATKDVQTALQKAIDGLNVVSTLTNTDKITKIVNKYALGSVAEGVLGDARPTLDRINAEVVGIRDRLDNIKEALQSPLVNAIDKEWQVFANDAATQLQAFVKAEISKNPDFFANDDRAAKAIHERLVAIFRGSRVVGTSQAMLRQFVGDSSLDITSLVDALFGQLNDIVSKSLSGGTDNLSKPSFDLVKNLGGGMLVADIKGSPTIHGNSLRKIHLDAKVQLKMGASLEFDGYIDMMELNSENTAVACIPAGEPAVEIRLGAKDVRMNWAEAKDIRLSVGARWTLQGGAVKGVGGEFTLSSKDGVGVGQYRLFEVGALLHVGEQYITLGAKCKALISVLGIPVRCEAALLMGRACSWEDLLFVDADAKTVLMQGSANTAPPNFSGIYIKGGAGFSLSDILFGLDPPPPVDIWASLDVAYYMQGDFLNLENNMSAGGAFKAQMDVSLPLVSGSARLAAAFKVKAKPVTLAFAANAEVCVKVFLVPEVCAGIGVRGSIVVKDGHLDLAIDY